MGDRLQYYRPFLSECSVEHGSRIPLPSLFPYHRRIEETQGNESLIDLESYCFCFRDRISLNHGKKMAEES